MDVMQLNNPNPPQINLESTTEQIPMKNRRDRAKERQEEFYKQIAEANKEIIEETVKQKADPDPDEDFGTQEEKPEQNVTEEENSELDEKTIPRKRLNKEIEARKALEEELRQERDKRVKSETELNLYNQALASLQNDKKPSEPETDIDPVDSEAHNLYMRKIHELEEKLKKQSVHTTESEQRQRFESVVNNQAAQFSQSNPDFDDAYKYLLNTETNKAKYMGYSDEEAQQFALKQLQPIAWEVYNKGGNVAETAYKMAKNYGYKASTVKKVSNSPDLDKVSKNMAKSHSILDEVPGVSTSIAPEQAAYNTMEGFKQKLSGKFGRGTNVDEFQKALKKLQGNG